MTAGRFACPAGGTDRERKSPRVAARGLGRGIDRCGRRAQYVWPPSSGMGIGAPPIIIIIMACWAAWPMKRAEA